jgi:hypothetical protein
MFTFPWRFGESLRLPASICDTWSQTCRSPDSRLTECHERQPFGYVLRQGEREHHATNGYKKSHPAPIALNPARRGLEVDSYKRRFLREEQFLRGNVADKGITALYTVSQIGLVFRADHPRFEWCCFSSSSFGGPACYFPEARAPVVLVPAG